MRSCGAFKVMTRSLALTLKAQRSPCRVLTTGETKSQLKFIKITLAAVFRKKWRAKQVATGSPVFFVL